MVEKQKPTAPSDDQALDTPADLHDKAHQQDDGDKNEPDEKSEDEGGGEDTQKRSKKPLIILAIVILVIAVFAAIYAFATRNHISTDDAYTDGNAITIAPKISGYIVSMTINDNTFVHAGDVMLQIDPRDYINARDTAAANLLLAKAQLLQAQTNYDIAKVKYPAQLIQAEAQKQQSEATAFQADQEYKRQHSVNQRATTQTNVDTATAQQKSALGQVTQAQAQIEIAKPVSQYLRAADAQVKQAEAQVAQAQAQLDQAELNLSYTEIRAPQDGWVTMRNVQLGTYVQAGQSLFELVTKDIWVIANFKESQLDHMRAGQKVDITVDAYPDLTLTGHVDTIQMGSGSRFSAFPAENATGNFVKIVQRVPVKIIIDGDKDGKKKDDWQTLPIGLSVEPLVHIGSEPKNDQKNKQPQGSAK
jgi:membrane fusion protein (multidrug efflux system)